MRRLLRTIVIEMCKEIRAACLSREQVFSWLVLLCTIVFINGYLYWETMQPLAAWSEVVGPIMAFMLVRASLFWGVVMAGGLLQSFM